MRVHLWLLVVLVPAVAGGFFDRMVARYRERREHRHEERFRPIFVDYQDEMEKLIAENAANMESEHPEFALGVPVNTGYDQRPQTRQRYRRERLRGLGQRAERTPTEEGQRGHEEHQEQERPRNRLRGAGMLLFGRRRRPLGRPRLRTPPTPVPPTTTRPTETPPHHIRLPTAIDGFDGISPSTRRPAAYIGPHGRVVLRDRDPIGAGQPPYRRRPPHRAPSERRRPVPARRHPVRGCRGRRSCVEEGKNEGLVPMPLPTPPPNYHPKMIRPENAVPTKPWTTKIREPEKTRLTSEKPSPQSRAIENHLSETMDPRVNPGRGSRRTTRTPAEVTQRPTTAAQIPVPESKESIPGGEALFEAMTSVLDTARVAMLAMMPHVPGIESASYGTKMTKAPSSEKDKAASSALSDDPMLGQGSTEHSGSFARHTVKPMPDLRRLRATTSHPTVSNFDTNDMLYTRQEETEEEKEQDSSDIRWANLLAAAGEEDLATVYGMLERARENREIMSRVRSRQRVGFQGTSTSGEEEKVYGNAKINGEAPSFRDEIPLTVKEREEKPATNTASIRAQLKAIVESLENEPNRPDQAVGQGHDDWKAFDKYSSGRSSVSEIGTFSQHPSMPPEVHKLKTDESEPVFRSGEERFPINAAPVIYAIWGSRRDKDKHIGRTSSETGGKPIHTSNAGERPTHYVDDGYPLSEEALFSSQDQARHYHDENTNLNDNSEQKQGTKLSYPDGSAQLDKGAGLGFREPSHNRNSKLSRVPAEEDGFSNTPQSVGDGRRNRYILGPSDLRDVEYTHQDGDSFVEDGINARVSDASYNGFKEPAGNAQFRDGHQVRPSIAASENDFTPRPIQLHKPYFEIHSKASKIQADIQQSDERKTMDNFSPSMAPNIASTEDAGFTVAKQPSDEAISEKSGSNSNLNSRAGQDQVDEQTSPPHSTVPGGRRPEDASSKVRPAAVHPTSTDVLHSGQPANEPQQSTGSSEPRASTTTSPESTSPSTASPQPVAEVSIATPSPHPTTAPSTSDQAALQETDQPTFATTVQSAPRTTSQPTSSEETVTVSLTLEELMRLISQVSQKPPSAMEETTLTALGIEKITEKTREEDGHEIVHAPKINGEDNPYEEESEDPFEHVESGENVENAATRPMESTQVQNTDKTFPAHHEERTFRVNQRKDGDEMDDTSFRETYPRTTSSSIESDDGRYAGSLRPPPTAPMTTEQYQSTEASRSDDKDDGLGFGAPGLQRSSTPTSRSEVLLTTEVIPEVQMRSTLTTEHLQTTIPSNIQTSQQITSPTYAAITTPQPLASPTTSTTSDASYLREPPTTIDFPTTQASPPVVEMFAIPTFGEWLVAPATEARDYFNEGEEGTTSSMVFEAVAVPTVDDWFETVTSSSGTTSGFPSALTSQPSTTTRQATATTSPTSTTRNPPTTTTSTSTSTTLQAFTTGTKPTTSPATRATSSKPTMTSSKSSPKPTTSQKPAKMSPEPKTTSPKSTMTSTAPVTSSLKTTTTRLSPTTSNFKPETTIPDPTKSTSMTSVASSTTARSQTSSTSDQPTTTTTAAAATTTRPTTTSTKPTTTTTTEPTTTTTTATEPTTITTRTTTTTRPKTTTTSPTTTTSTQTTTTTKSTTTTKRTTTTEPTMTTTSETTTTTRSTTTMLSSVPTTTTEVLPIRSEEVTTPPLSLLEQVMTRSVPFIKKRRRFTTPTSVETTTDGSKIEPIQTTSSYKEPSSVMPRPDEHTTANPGLVTSRRESLRYDVEVAKPDIQATDEEDGEDRNTPTKSPLPKMSPELRMALVRELLKQMQAAKQSNQKKTKAMSGTKSATQTYHSQPAEQDDEQPKMQTIDETAADTSSNDEEENEEDPPPIEEESDGLTIDPEPSAQIEASRADLEGLKQNMEAKKASKNLKVDVKVDPEVKTEAERIAALLKGDVPQTKTISIRQEPETSEESQEPVTPSAFLRALRERVKNRPSIRGSRKKTRPKPRRRGKIRKSLPRGPRPSTEDEEDETEDVEDDNDEKMSEEDPKHSEQPRAKLHQLVNAELNSQNDEEAAAEGLDNLE